MLTPLLFNIFIRSGSVLESGILLRRGTDPGDPYSFTIAAAAAEDSGLYSCVAGNILGETVRVASLEVSTAARLGPGLVLALLPLLTPLL